MPEARYEKVIEAFGGKGDFVTTPSQLEGALQESLTKYADEPVIINVAINPQSSRKQQVRAQGYVGFSNLSSPGQCAEALVAQYMYLHNYLLQDH